MAREYFVTEAAKALKLPDHISWDHGSMIEPLAVAVHAVRRYGDVKDKKVLVLGGGTIGNLVAQTAKAMGANKVLISEISEYRLEVAKKAGIETVNPVKKDLMEAINDFFGPDRADVIFECVGANETINQAIEYARKGSHIIVVGVFEGLVNMNAAFIQDHELTVAGTAMYRVEDYKKAIELTEAGLIEFDSLITNHVPFKEYQRAYQIVEEQKDKATKVIIVMEED